MCTHRRATLWRNLDISLGSEKLEWIPDFCSTRKRFLKGKLFNSLFTFPLVSPQGLGLAKRILSSRKLSKSKSYHGVKWVPNRKKFKKVCLRAVLIKLIFGSISGLVTVGIINLVSYPGFPWYHISICDTNMIPILAPCQNWYHILEVSQRSITIRT